MQVPDPEKVIDAEELSIPLLGAGSVGRAYRRALDAGHSVLVSSNGHLWEVQPDGQRIRGKAIERRVPVEKGVKVIIQ